MILLIRVLIKENKKSLVNDVFVMKNGTLNNNSCGFKNNIIQIYLSVIIFGLPLIFNNGYSNITETKSLFFVSISSVLLLFFAIIFVVKLMKKCNKVSIKNLSFIDISFLSFAFFVLLSSILSKYQQDVWLGYNSRYQGAIIIFIYFFLYFIISQNYSFSQQFILSAIISFSIVCILGVLNCFDIDLFGFYSIIQEDSKRMFISTIGNINFYSSYICLLLPLVLCGFCMTVGTLSNVIYTTVLIVGSFGMMVTGSESFVVGFTIAVIIIPFFMFKRVELLKKFFIGIIIIFSSTLVYRLIYEIAPVKNIKISLLLSFITNPVISIVICLICICCYLILNKNEKHILKIKYIYIACIILIFIAIIVCLVLSNTIGLGELDKIFKITSNWGTYRGGIWEQCIDTYKDFSLKEKLFGIGPEALYNISVSPDNLKNQILDQAHNEYIQYLLTTGLFGLLSYISILISVSFCVFKYLQKNTLAIGLLSSLIAFWIQGVFNMAQPFTTPIMYIYIAIIGGLIYKEKMKMED